MNKQIVKTDDYKTVKFNGINIICPFINGIPYFVLKCISDGIGMNSQAVHRAVKKHPRFKARWTAWSPVKDKFDLSSKHNYPCLPIHKLAAWLYSISINDVGSDAKENLFIYQEKCDDVLMNHFFGGKHSLHNFQQKRLPVKNEIIDKEEELKASVILLEESEVYLEVQKNKDELRKLREKLNRIDKSFVEPEIFGYDD